MDKTWISRKRTTPEFKQGVEEFIRFALERNKEGEQMCCPCKICGNMNEVSTVDELREHIFWNGFSKNYTEWIWHGEGISGRSNNQNDDLVGNLDDNDANDNDGLEDMLSNMEDDVGDMAGAFDGFLNRDDKTQLPFVLKLFKLKADGKWTDKSFTELLKALKEMYAEAKDLPDSTYHAKKMLCPMGLDAEKIHACPNDCVLYRKEYKDLRQCPICGVSRYKVSNKALSDKDGPPAKVLWYLPIVPRFKRLFQNVNDSKNLTWHADEREKDGMLRHVADSPQWEHIDKTFPQFGKEARNLRLGLCTDGLNPFGNMSSQHSTWPVVLTIYNLPPWLSMKRKYMMLSLLISGPKQPGNDIDIYLAPLIEDLIMLWDKGVPIFDAYRQETFTLRAIVYCTINDFPAYGNLSGHATKGYKACPICEDDTKAISLPKSKKIAYMGFRRFLPRNHTLRRLRKAFDGKPEYEVAPKTLSGKQVFDRVKNIVCIHGKPYKPSNDQVCYKKKSIFWSLPYFQHLFVRHCIDVMHVEKNVFDSLFGTLLNMAGKTKDGEKARGDMEVLGIRPELKAEKRGKRTYLPPACYTLSKKEKKILCESLHDVKVPHGYSSNVRNLVSLKDLKLVGLKSHDCHTLMQDILPVAIRSILPKQVRQTIIRLCLFFKALCSRVLDPGKLDSLQAQVVVTLCQLEMYFPPSFFDIMVHLVVHLVREVKLCGPVYLRYMYPFERYMGYLKGFVRNRARPEGSMIEGYLSEEVLGYCIEHLAELEKVGLPNPRHDEDRIQGRGTIGRKVVSLKPEKLDEAYLYILQQSVDVHRYVVEHMNLLRYENPGKVEKFIRDEHNRLFIKWFRQKVKYESEQGCDVSDVVQWLAFGPDSNVISYQGYDINGYCFYTKKRDDKSTVQNSGVTLEASGLHFSNAKDNNPRHVKSSYYGVIENIFELDFIQFKVPMLECKWVDISKGIKNDEEGYTSVNFDKIGHQDEPFIMASQAKQVFYMKDPVENAWSVVIEGKKHGVAAVDLVPNKEDYGQIDDIPSFSLHDNTPLIVDDFSEHYLRDDHNEGVWIGNTTTN